MEFGPFGLSELLFIALLALVLLGPRRLPEIGHAVGRMTAKLRRATNELRNTWEAELDDESRESMRDAARQLRQVREDLASAGREVWQGGADAAALADGALKDASRNLTGGGDPPEAAGDTSAAEPSGPAPTAPPRADPSGLESAAPPRAEPSGPAPAGPRRDDG